MMKNLCVMLTVESITVYRVTNEIKRKTMYEDDYYEEDERTYERHNGSYAQDVEGYDDDTIDEVFDGDPDAYWNID